MQGSSEELAPGLVLTDDNNQLGKWEDEAAVEHWGRKCFFKRSTNDAMANTCFGFFLQ